MWIFFDLPLAHGGEHLGFEPVGPPVPGHRVDNRRE